MTKDNQDSRQTYKCVACGHELTTTDLSSIRCPKCEYKGLELKSQDSSSLDEFYDEWADRLRTNCESCEHPVCEAHRNGFKRAIKQLVSNQRREAAIEELETLANVEAHAAQDNEFSDGYQNGFKDMRRIAEDRLAELKESK